MISILGISGSPRKKGNSAFLLDRALESAVAVGAERLPVVYVNEMEFRGCQNCGGCAKTGVCTEKDDMTEVYPLLRQADIWLFATSIFFDNITGQLKTFFDRLYCLDKPPGSKLSGRRSGGFLIVYEDKPRRDYLQYTDIYLKYLSWFGDFVYTEALEGPGLADPSDAVRHPELAARAEALGARLVEKLRSA
jgi:multimeric flavodoxin WrbA